MKALIVYGSKHGSTREIAERMSQVLEVQGIQTTVADAQRPVGVLERYDVIIVGSAIRIRSWLRPPLRFILSNRSALLTKQVWLFSSGLLVDDPRSLHPRSLRKIERTIEPREHRFFIGSLQPGNLSPIHKMVLRLPVVKRIFPMGDDRNWNEIEDWASTIARSAQVGGSGMTRMMNKDPSEAKRSSGLDQSGTMVE